LNSACRVLIQLIDKYLSVDELPLRGTERVVDVEGLEPARFDRLAELIDQGRTQSRDLALAGRILQATDGRLRGQRRAALRTTASCKSIRPNCSAYLRSPGAGQSKNE
jgi:hypothetical protein